MIRPLRVGIVGCGNVALNFHVPAYHAAPEHFLVTALADPTPERLELGRNTAGLREDQVHADAAALIQALIQTKRQQLQRLEDLAAQHPAPALSRGA